MLTMFICFEETAIFGRIEDMYMAKEELLCQLNLTETARYQNLTKEIQEKNFETFWQDLAESKTNTTIIVQTD